MKWQLTHTCRLRLDDAGGLRAFGPLSTYGLSTDSVLRQSSRLDTPAGQRDTALLTPPTLTVNLAQSSSFLSSAALRIQDLPLNTDIRVVDHLLTLYFIWHHSVFPILSLHTFTEAFAKRGTYYSPLLLNVSSDRLCLFLAIALTLYLGNLGSCLSFIRLAFVCLPFLRIAGTIDSA